MFYRLAGECLHAPSHCPHPSLVRVVQVGRPRDGMVGGVRRGQDGQHHAVGADEQDLQNVGQHLPSRHGLTGAVVSGDDDG